jgi:transcription elongation GreA/GreB family factor
MPKKVLTLALAVCLLQVVAGAQTPAKPQPATTPINVALTDGTPVKLRLGTAAAANGTRVGETIELEVAEDVRVSDVVVIAKGNVANAEVTGLHAGLGSGTRFDVNLRSITLSDEHVIPVRSTHERANRDDQAMVISNATQDASIAPGTTVIAYVDGNQTVDTTRLRAAAGTTQTLRVVSTPSNAEVSVDGHLSGSTPYIFHVAAGEHSVVIRMVGFQSWQGTVRVGSDVAKIEATLVKQDGMESIPASRGPAASLGDLARAARARKAQDNAGPATDLTQKIEEQSEKRDPMQPTGNK